MSREETPMETLAIGTLVSTRFGNGIIGRLPYAKRGPGMAYIVRMVDGEHEGRELCFFAPSYGSDEEWPFAPLVHGPEETLASGTLVNTPLGVGIVKSQWQSIYGDRSPMYFVNHEGACFDFPAQSVEPLVHGPEETPKKRTVVPCPAFSTVLGYWQAELIFHHETGNVTLESDLRIDYVEFETEWKGAKENRIAQLRSDKGFRWNVPAEAWEAIQSIKGESNE